jgi:hypothetical protein
MANSKVFEDQEEEKKWLISFAKDILDKNRKLLAKEEQRSVERG